MHGHTNLKFGLPDDEHMMVETCRRHEELNKNTDFKRRVHSVGLHYIIVSQCTVQTLHKFPVFQFAPVSTIHQRSVLIHSSPTDAL